MLPSLACDPYSCMAPWLPLTPLTVPLARACVCIPVLLSILWGWVLSGRTENKTLHGCCASIVGPLWMTLVVSGQVT